MRRVTTARENNDGLQKLRAEEMEEIIDIHPRMVPYNFSAVVASMHSTNTCEKGSQNAADAKKRTSGFQFQVYVAHALPVTNFYATKQYRWLQNY